MITFTYKRMLIIQREHEYLVFKGLNTGAPQALIGGFWEEFEAVRDGEETPADVKELFDLVTTLPELKYTVRKEGDELEYK